MYFFFIEMVGVIIEILLKFASESSVDKKSTLVQLMAWCCRATSHYMTQSWQSHVMRYGITGLWYVLTEDEWCICVNKLWPSLIQIMACDHFGTKLLSKPIRPYSQSDPWWHISVKFEWKHNNFNLRKCLRKHHLRIGGNLVSASIC